jgi:hypothetical protein
MTGNFREVLLWYWAHSGLVGGMPGEEGVALRAVHDGGDGLEGVGTRFNEDIGMGDQVVIPVGVLRLADDRAEYHVAVAVLEIAERIGAADPRLRADGGEQEKRLVREIAADLASGGAELGDDEPVLHGPVRGHQTLAIPVLAACTTTISDLLSARCASPTAWPGCAWSSGMVSSVDIRSCLPGG